MPIVSASRLSSSDLASSENSLKPASRSSRVLAAVNRSLAIHGESVQRLFRPGLRPNLACAARPISA